jgi:S1-C subfamily serine protease
MSDSITINDETYYSLVKILVSNIKYNVALPFSTSEQSTSIGSGFFISDRHILTAAHVINESSSFVIQLPKHGQKFFEGEILSVYPDFDVALLKIKGYRSNNYLSLGDSDSLTLGLTVFALGYPDDSTVPLSTKGTISGLRDDNIQTDAALNPGNSGGPLLAYRSDTWKVIGINSSIFKDSDGAGFAIPISYFKTVEAIMYQKNSLIIHKPTVGFSVQNINLDYHDMLNQNVIPADIGVRIQQLCKLTSLREVDINVGDILLEVDHNRIDSHGECNVKWSKGKVPFSSLVKRKERGSIIHFKIYRNSSKVISDIYHVLQDTPALFGIREYFPFIDTIPYEIVGGIVFMDLSINHITDEKFIFLSYLILQNKLDQPRLLISHIFPDSANLHYNIISAGNLVNKINDNPVSSVQDLRSSMMHPIFYQQEAYFKIETDDGNVIYLKIPGIIDHDQTLSKKYHFTLSESWEKLSNYASNSP